GSNAGGDAKLTAASSVANFGTITLTSIDGGYASDLTLNNGAVLTNNGRIYIDHGSGAPRRIAGRFPNAGDPVISTDTTFNSPTDTYVNTGVVAVYANLTLNGGGAQSFSQNGGSLGVEGAFLMSGGTFTLNDGTVDNSGRFSLSGGTFNFNGGS